MTRKVTSLPVTEKTVCTTNADQNRVSIDRIILHTMVGTASGADARFNDCTSKVSAHYGVLESGEIWHWVDEDWVAYHAGNDTMNQRSIAIEHEDNGDYNGVRPDSLYNSSASLVADICKFYEIPCDRQHILKHNEVIATGCPDALDVDRIVKQAGDILNPPTSVIIIDPQAKIQLNPPYGVTELQAINSMFKAKDQYIASHPDTPVESPQTLPDASGSLSAPETTILSNLFNQLRDWIKTALKLK